MRERARLIGAAFKVTSEPASGTTVSVRVPLEQQETAATA
jgi:signal transduction histidine kinase